MPDLFDVRNPTFHDLIPADTQLERVAAGLTFTEGPVWRGDHLLFSDIPNARIARWRRLPEGPELTTFTTGHSNGLTLDRQGCLLAAEHIGRRVTRIAEDGARTVLAEHYQGKHLNSPNDLVVHSSGAVYFTDPPYGMAPRGARPPGWWQGDLPGRELPYSGVFRLDPGGALSLVADDFALPNGLAFSPDERILYVDDSHHQHIRAFDVRDDGSLANGRVILHMKSEEEGVPDGMKVDAAGNLYCTGGGGIWVARPNGELLGIIRTPEIAANLAWGEPDWSTLFITARTSVYRLRTRTAGLPVG